MRKCFCTITFRVRALRIRRKLCCTTWSRRRGRKLWCQHSCVLVDNKNPCIVQHFAMRVLVVKMELQSSLHFSPRISTCQKRC